jgi:hypothetical protein
MRERVFGVETEYAVIYHPGRFESARPTNLALYARFEAALRYRVRSLPHAFSPFRAKGGRFLENGASFHYEATPEDYEHGLIEIASPECRDPYALLVYERAKDELVEALAHEVNAELKLARYAGEVRIGKNNVDSQGNTFGSHENYWVEDRMSLASRLLFLPVWIALWAISLPVVAWVLIAQVAVLVGVLLAGTGLLATAALLAVARPGVARRLLSAVENRVSRVGERPGGIARRLHALVKPLYPLLALHSAVYNRFHFRRFRRHLTPFLVTRTVYTGAGAVAFDGGPLFRLAQRPPFVRALSRIFPIGGDRPVFETRDLFFRPWSALLSRRRLHLLLADANLCEWAQALRVGVTALVLEAIESGAPVDWPELADPLDALRRVSLDAELGERIELAGGGTATAVEIQRRYLAGVRRALLGGPEPLPVWKARVLRDWEETLELLERDPEALADRVDWVAKRRLLRREIPDRADLEALRARGAEVLGAEARTAADRRLRELAYRAWRVDLRYHELSARGGHRRLERRGEVRRLSDPREVERAFTEPPADTRARARGQAIKWAHAHALSGGVAWHRVRLGKFDWRWLRDPLDPGG